MVPGWDHNSVLYLATHSLLLMAIHSQQQSEMVKEEGSGSRRARRFLLLSVRPNPMYWERWTESQSVAKMGTTLAIGLGPNFPPQSLQSSVDRFLKGTGSDRTKAGRYLLRLEQSMAQDSEYHSEKTSVAMTHQRSALHSKERLVQYLVCCFPRLMGHRSLR